MDLGLTGRKAFVAASSAGLGRASADALLAEGAEVVISGRNVEKLEKTRVALAEKHGRNVQAVIVDLSAPGNARQAVLDAASRLGGLDILVTNSGGPPAGPFVAHDEPVWRAAIDQLVMATVEMVGVAIPELEKSDQPRIVMIASTSVKQPIPNLVLSNSLRAAVVGLAKTLSQELGPKQILVNVVCPGAIDTDRIRQLGFGPERLKEIPLGRLGQPEELGTLVAFLASARASYLTGCTIQVDGGSTKSLF
jgi:3-oxoacyl-[acyl-carrier protein] reductase